MPPLDHQSLIAIKELISDPLLREVKLTIEAGHKEQARDIGEIAARLQRHDTQLQTLRVEVGGLKAFKRHIAAVCAMGALVGGTAWGLAVDWFKGEFFPAKP